MTTTKAVTVRAERSMFGKLTGKYVAEIGGLEAIGTTRDEAVFILTEQISTAAQHAHTRQYRVSANGTVFALHHSPFAGWGYDIVHADGSWSSCAFGKDYTHRSALESMERHVVQYNEQGAICV